MKKKKLKKNLNRKPISYSTELRLDINLNNFVRKLCPAMINAFQDTFCFCLYKRDYSTGGNNGQTYRPSDEAGPIEEHSLLKSGFQSVPIAALRLYKIQRENLVFKKSLCIFCNMSHISIEKN